MFPERVLAEDFVTQYDDGVRIALRIPWYRALPLSCVDKLDIEIDATPIPTERLRVTVNGATHRYADLPPLHDEWWFVTDDAEVLVEGLRLGAEQAHVAVTLGLRIPYLPIGPGRFIPMAETCERTVDVRKAA